MVESFVVVGVLGGVVGGVGRGEAIQALLAQEGV